jgi:hypothetical protein
VRISDHAKTETTMAVLGSLIRRPQLERRRAFIESYTFPPALQDKLREELGDEYRVAPALEGLREWYLACLSAGGDLLGMPSRAVDVAWHEMILMTREYHAFCERAFGRYLHHSPEAVAGEPMEALLARTLAVVDRRSSATAAALPLLFAVDSELGLEDGLVWTVDDLERLRLVRPDHGGAYITYPWAAAGCSGGHGGCSGGGCSGGGCGGGGG